MAQQDGVLAWQGQCLLVRGVWPGCFHSGGGTSTKNLKSPLHLSNGRGILWASGFRTKQFVCYWV